MLDSMRIVANLIVATFIVAGFSLSAAEYPAPVQNDWTARDFHFHDGDVLPELKLHYATVGAATGEPVLILHGSNGSSSGFFNQEFAGELFGPGQPLDARKYFVILPDSLGAGKSAKPSDGMRAKFPRYNYDDIVNAQYRLVSEHLGIKHLRLIVGVSGGGMQTWQWSVMYPDFMDTLVPMAAQPTAMAGRNWMMRRMIIDAVRNDPEWHGGNYEKQPPMFKTAQVFFGIATAGGAHQLHKLAPTREKADAELDRRLAQGTAGDANDALYQWDASRDYDPAPQLEKIQAKVLAINSADDERNPPELGTLDREIKRVKNGRYILIPLGPETRGHGTVGNAKFWKQYLAELLGL